jgi:hypothetical protein
MSIVSTETPPDQTKLTAATAEPSFGWNIYAEQVNGRFAMVGFVLLLILELVTGQDLWTWLGLR